MKLKSVKGTWFEKWCKFMRSLEYGERLDLYKVLTGLRGPDYQVAGEPEVRDKQWSWRIRWAMGFGDQYDGAVLPELAYGHYKWHVEAALDVLEELGVI